MSNSDWTFQYLPPTSNPPVITSVTPADGSFFRKPSLLTIKATLINDPGNGLSDYSDITFDGVVIPGTVTGNILTGSWQIMSESQQNQEDGHYQMAGTIR